MKSVRFCDEQMLNKFKKLRLIQNYVTEKQAEIAEHNKKLGIDDDSVPNGRRTNKFGCFQKIPRRIPPKQPKNQ